MDDKQENEFWDDQRPQMQTRKSSRGAIKLVMVITAVCAATAVCISQLVRAIMSEGEGTAVGQFAIINAMMPTVFLVGAYFFFRIFGRYID